MEGDAGTRRLNPTDAEDTPDESVAASEQEQTDRWVVTAKKEGQLWKISRLIQVI